MKSRWLLLVAARGDRRRRLRRQGAGDACDDAGLQRHDAGEGHVRRISTSRPHTIPANLWKAQLKTKGDSDLYVQQNTWDPSLCGGCIPSPAGTRIPGRAS